MKRKTKLAHVIEALSELKVGEALSKVAFVEKHWGDYNFFTARSFDVFSNKAKKLLPEKKFNGKFNKEIKRIS